MGVSISSNAATSIQNQANSIINEFVSSCTIQTKNSQTINSDNCKIGGGGGSVKVNISNTSVINEQCLQNVNVKAQITAKMSSAMQQQAQAITQSLGMPSVAASVDVLNSTQNLANKIVSNFYNTCLINNSSVQSFNCKNSTIGGGGQVVFNISNDSTFITDCIQNIVSDSTEVSELTQTISQSAVAKEANSIAVFGVFIVLIAIALMYFTMQELNGPIGWLIVFLVIGSILSGILYTYSAVNNNNYPYRRS